MKKGFIVFTTVMILFLSIPFSAVFANTGGFLDGDVFRRHSAFDNTGGNTSNAITDNNVSTYLAIFPSERYVFNNTMFPTPENVNSYYLSIRDVDLPKMNYLTLQFYDSNKTLIAEFTNLVNNKITSIPSVKNVSYVLLKHTGTGTTDNIVYIGELNIYNMAVHDEITDLVIVDMNPGVSMSWTVPSNNADFTGSKIYRNGTFLTSISGTTNVYNDTTAIDGQTYTYKVTATYSDGFETAGVSSTISPVTPPDTVAPLEPTGIQYSPTKDTILVTWTDPTDEDLKQINIYKDGVLVGNSIKGTGSYTLTNLTSETAYSVKLTAVDFSGNESVGVVQSVTTTHDVDLTAPTAPTGLDVTNYSNGALVKWNKNLEADIKGYNIYVDGVKDNVTPITATSYQILGLEVGQTYSITVTAVDTSNNESAHSVAGSAVPSATAIPILEMGYELKDVADGVSGWFSNMWLILAFAVAIPLAFYIAMRTKLLFVG